ncbi:hypothetical protein BDV96DRAFT_555274 [Lophiotrema nucula]|uniref:non-specific serine/threonine protein kinase n=1 Tax=Lophiotrema nucula TaxID=690887 RepID=A0A6A5YSB5_9PLEO|nr:hypothetical protein BDV96DRAFT_555274 [Lophiotrema nucula]
MPRRRPPGAGPGLSTTLVAALLLLPWIATAAQQQHPPQNAHRRSPREDAYAESIVPPKQRKPGQDQLAHAAKRDPYTPLLAQNERAVATKVSSAPADSAVRAPSPRNAAQKGDLNRPSARSLEEWSVEDFVLLATVDGHLHARDRYNGDEIWELNLGKPMLETIYHTPNDSGADDSPSTPPFMWIVEPKEDGKLYILTPGQRPVLQSLGMTIKDLAEHLSPYAGTDPPYVYTAQKRNVMHVVDARTGLVKKTFSPGGQSFVNADSCDPSPTEMFDAKERECTGFFNLGQTEYIISIFKDSGETICTIKYAEWTANNRDVDLHSQYITSRDNQYIYSRYDGRALAFNHNRPKRTVTKRPVFERKLTHPVVRVFDVARPPNDDDPDPALVLLPQPPLPSVLEDKEQDVWLNTTEAGSWYALSELNYPAVTDSAPRANCLSLDWIEHNSQVNVWDNQFSFPDRDALVGVHSIKPILETGWGNTKQLEPPMAVNSAPSQPEPQAAEDKSGEISSTDALVGEPPGTEQPAEKVKSDDQSDKASVATSELTERRVRFDVPDDDEADMEPLSRTTTAEEPSREGDEGDDTNGTTANGTPTQANGTENGAPGTSKKKKTHRGKRGGGKNKSKKAKENEDEVDQIVQAAKELDQGPTLHPDDMAVTGDDVQDVSNVKRIGKLTIDFDRLLGNGSGGTFVFAGKWKDRDVAVKRMLPQYFGLAEQEIKLLQESDHHDNVIRYYDDEKDENFLYIAVELCQASLWDLYRDGRPEGDLSDCQNRLVTEINTDVSKALKKLARGVNHLHSLRIIHRDIKPQNILIAYPKKNDKDGPRLVISDFGLCKTLPDNVSTLIGTTGNAGTVGWKAPELILQPKDMDRGSSTGHSRDSSSSTDPVAQGVKRAVDIFSLGCVFFYVLTNGSHPFDDDEGWMQVRELNIKKDKPNLQQLRMGADCEEPIHLIQWMLSNKPEERPTALQIMNHPFFWSAQKRLNFLCDVSDHWEREPRDPPSEHLDILERYTIEVMGQRPDFLGRLDHAFINSLGKQRKYTKDRMLDLLRALRNKKNHYEDMDEAVKMKVGPLPEGYLSYWTTKFPQLLIACYKCVQWCELQDQPRFRIYFEDPAEA